MTIQEILEAHTVKRPWSEASRMRCKCGETVTAETDGQLHALHRAHVAQVLEEHEREAKAAALEEAADEIEAKAERLSPDDSFQQGARIGIITSAVDLQTRAAQLMATQ